MIQQPNSSYARIPYTQRCRLWRGEQVQDGLLCNVSRFGVYVTVDEIPALGEEVRISFPLPDGGAAVEAAAVVTWQNLEEPQKIDSLPPGCGLRFASLRPTDGARLDALIAEYGDQLPLGIGAPPPESGYVRVPYIQRCKLTEAGVARSAVLCNISTLGAYVTVDPVPALGAAVEIALLLPGDSRTFRARATVTWSNPEPPAGVSSLAPGCGLRFDELPHSDRLRVERVVRDYCSGSTPLD
jgi:Tfp pilus assembly protein PilZ